MTKSDVTLCRRLARVCARRCFPTLARASFGAIALIPALVTLADAEIPKSIRAHESGIVEGSSTPGTDGRTHVKVRTAQRTLELVLEPSPITRPGADVVVIDANGEHIETSPRLFRGHVAGDPDSNVRVALTDSSIIGSAATGGETWFFEPRERYDRGARPHETVVYRKSDIDVSAEPGTCAAESSPLALGAVASSTQPAASTPPVVTGTSGTGLIELSVVADYAFYQAHGANTAAYMQSIIDQVAGFYPNDIGVTLAIARTVIYQAPGLEPLSSSTASTTLLQSLAQARDTYPSTIGAGDITQLFTGRDLDQNVIGIAYLGTVCDDFYASSVAQDFSTNLHLMTLLTGHELGHSLGASHDGQTGSPCVGTDFGYVMWPVVYSSLAEAFSPCSAASIAPYVSSASCIGDAIPVSCGDGDLDAGEVCDDGNNSNGDCCRLDCKYEPAGSTCAADSNQCTNDVCNGLGTCTHPNSTASCDDHDACSAEGQCSAGSCQSTADLAPLWSPKLKSHLRGGGEDSLAFAGVISASMASLPTDTGAVVRFLDDAGGVLHESNVAAAGWVQRNTAGTSYSFDAEDAGLVATSGGVVVMRVKYKPADAFAKIKVRLAQADLSFLDGRDHVDVQVLLGNAVSGDCGTTFDLVCEASDGLLACS